MFVEKRKYKRIPVKKGIYAVIKPQDGRMGQIVNISQGGLLMRYVEGILKEPHPCSIEITCPEQNIIFDHIPLKSTSSITSSNKVCSYLRVEFDHLSMEQNCFINYVATKFKSRA